MKTHTTTSIEPEIMERIKKAGFRVNDLILIGLQEREQGSKWGQRVAMLEAENAQIQEKLKKYVVQNWELAKRVKDLEEKPDVLHESGDVLHESGGVLHEEEQEK